MSSNTLFLRLEGPMQAWGNQESKFVIRRTSEAPTKSGVIGMMCAALGVSRPQASRQRLAELGSLRMGVRIDRPGVRWWDYATVGAQVGLLTAEGKIKHTASTKQIETLVTRREYLCDASFLVALQGNPDLVARLVAAMKKPKWTLYLGRKSCPPSRPLLEHPAANFPDLIAALTSISWRRRLRGDDLPPTVTCLLDWEATPERPEAPNDAFVWYDVPLSFKPPAHRPRFVIREEWQVGKDGDISVADVAAQHHTPAPPRPRPDYQDRNFRKARKERLTFDHHLCVFCKSPGTTVHHITYQHAGGDERLDELRTLCRLCHDSVTMIEYGMGMGLDRINPEEDRWREKLMEKRKEIIRFRSLETRRRHLSREEIE